MEEKKQNQEVELTALQMQYKKLQEKFNQQEIVNNDLIHEIIHTKIGDFKRRNMEIVLSYGLLAAAACWSWYRFDLRLSFLVISIVLFALIGLFEWFSCRKVLKISTEDSDIQTLVQKMENVRTRFSLVWITGVFVLCVWMMWFIREIGKKLTIDDYWTSFVVVAAILTLSIILTICNIDRLTKMSDELLAQTSRLNGNNVSTIPAYHRSGGYWSGIVMLLFSLIFFVFKLIHMPGANLALLVAGVAGEVFVILTARHLVRIVPEEKPVIRIAEVASLFLVASSVCKLLHWPLGNLFGLISVLLLLIAALVYWLRGRRERRQGEVE